MRATEKEEKKIEQEHANSADVYIYRCVSHIYKNYKVYSPRRITTSTTWQKQNRKL